MSTAATNPNTFRRLRTEEIDARNPLAVALYAYRERLHWRGWYGKPPENHEELSYSLGRADAYTTILSAICGSDLDERVLELLIPEFPHLFPRPA